MARKVWIEVALNGAWGRDVQPGIPATVQAIVAEGIACAKAGAAITIPTPMPTAPPRPSTGRSMPASSKASVRR